MSTTAAKRVPVSYQFQALNWNFIKLMAEVASYAKDKYGSTENYTLSRLEGEKSPVNHIINHVQEYVTNTPHDRYPEKSRQMHLAAIAYNAMMEYYYLEHGGPTMTEVFYTKNV